MSPELDAGGGGGSSAPATGGSMLSAPAPAAPAASISAPPGAPGSAAVPTAPAQTVNIPENWKESLPEEFRNDPAMKAIADLQSLAKSYLHSQKMIGADKVQVPGKHATKEDWRAYFHKAGLPNNVTDYKLELPKDAGFDEKFVSGLREKAFEVGIPPNQMNELMGWYASENKTALEFMDSEYKQKVQEGFSGLKQEWGQAYNQNLETAKRAIKHFADKNGVPNINTWLDGTGIGDDPMMTKLLNYFGSLLKEDKIHGAEFVPQQKDPGTLLSEANAIIGDKKSPYYDKTHPNHKAVVAEVSAMFQKAYDKVL
jgi:hypothetical protein